MLSWSIKFASFVVCVFCLIATPMVSQYCETYGPEWMRSPYGKSLGSGAAGSFMLATMVFGYLSAVTYFSLSSHKDKK